MFSTLINAVRIKDIRKKIIFIFLVVLMYRFGTHVPIPGINLATLQNMLTGGNADMATNLYTLIAGGGYGSLFVMGIAPYINASIIMQLLTVAIPYLERLKQEGEEGRKKINQITRIFAVAFSLIQAAATVYSYCYTQLGNLFAVQNILVYITAAASIVTGTIFIMWLGELLTEKGIGNGSSFIIFANIVSKVPAGAGAMYQMLSTTTDFMVYLEVILALCAFVVIIGFVVFVQGGERRIPVHYSKKMVGKQSFGGQSSFLPIKVNIAGVMSIIFAISIMQLPSTILHFFPQGSAPGWMTTVSSFMNPYGTFNGIPTGPIIYVVFIFFFTFFYTSYAINPVEIAENLKKNGGFIPGIRPGYATSEYITTVINRMSWIGGLMYSIIAILPVLMQMAAPTTGIGFGGTTLLIVTGVVLEFMKQLESQLVMRHYKGFLR